MDISVSLNSLPVGSLAIVAESVPLGDKVQVAVNIQEIIDFYDANKGARPHSNAIKTLAHEEFAVKVLVEYFKERGLTASALEAPCTAKNGGAWLDKWVEVAEGCSTVHYQVEVKGWSFHGYGGGKPLRSNCSERELREFMREEFRRYWNTEIGRFHAPGLDKVLKEMKSSHTGEVRPLACLWAPVHPEGNEEEPLFSVDNVEDSVFKTVWIFSVSAYLRQLLRTGRTGITLELPHTAARLDHLDRIFRRIPE